MWLLGGVQARKLLRTTKSIRITTRRRIGADLLEAGAPTRGRR